MTARGDSSEPSNPERYEIRTWRNRPAIDYGGPEVDVTARAVKRAVAAPDGRRVFLEPQGLERNTVVYLQLRGLKGVAGRERRNSEAWYALNAVSPLAGPGFDHPWVRRELPRNPPPGATVRLDGCGLGA